MCWLIHGQSNWKEFTIIDNSDYRYWIVEVMLTIAKPTNYWCKKILTHKTFIYMAKSWIFLHIIRCTWNIFPTLIQGIFQQSRYGSTRTGDLAITVCWISSCSDHREQKLYCTRNSNQVLRVCFLGLFRFR